MKAPLRRRRWTNCALVASVTLAGLSLPVGSGLLLASPPAIVDATPTGLPFGVPEGVGMSSERLPRIDEAVQRYVDDHKLAGAVTLVMRRGRVVHFAAHGLADLETKRPMRTDALFRMASCTKPVTAVAILMLMEEGKLRLTDPVSKFLPEFKDLKVAVLKVGSTTQPSTAPSDAVVKADAADFDLVPVARPITIRDLLTHTSGLGSGGASTKEMNRVMRDRKPADTLADVVPQYAAAPLDFQPGTHFRYSGLAAFDTLARIVEVTSGQTYEQFLVQRVFTPLGMRDTFFAVPDDRQPRLATLYRGTPKGLEKMPTPAFLANPAYTSGAGGLTSTAEDFARFAQMLVNGGTFNSHRLLSPRTVELMRTNHDGEMMAGQLGRPPGIGFGLSVEVIQDAARAGWRRSNGSFGWDGAFGTIFWVDPKEQMIAVMLVQKPGQEHYRDFENAIMQAIVD